MTELLSTENILSISHGRTKMPKIAHDGMIHMRSSELEGSFRTPGFGRSDYQGDFYSRAQSLRYVLDPMMVEQTMTNHSALVITVQSEGSLSFMLQSGRLHWYRLVLNHSAAEEFCVKR